MKQRPKIPRNASADTALRWHGWTVTDAGCWEFGGSRGGQGYGVVGRNGKLVATHRLAYETWVGPIPEGHVVRHKCDNRPCINPDHLETGTRADNNRDTAERGGHAGRRKLSDDDVFDVLWLSGLGATYGAIARAFGVSAVQVSNICRGKQRAPRTHFFSDRKAM